MLGEGKLKQTKARYSSHASPHLADGQLVCIHLVIGQVKSRGLQRRALGKDESGLIELILLEPLRTLHASVCRE